MPAQQHEPSRPAVTDVTARVGTVLRLAWASVGRQ